MPEGLEGLMESLGGCPMHSLLTLSSLRIGVEPRSALCFQETRFAAGVVRAVVAGCVKRMYLPGLCWGLVSLLPEEQTKELRSGPRLG